MNYKSIINAVAVAVAVIAVLLIGCVDNGVDPNDPNNPNNGGNGGNGSGIIGDWMIVEVRWEENGDSLVEKLSDESWNRRLFFYFDSSFMTYNSWYKYGDFWMEYGYAEENKYKLEGDSLLLLFREGWGTDDICDEAPYEEGECYEWRAWSKKYSISGDTLIITNWYEETFVGVRVNMANIRRSHGKVYSLPDSRLYDVWWKPAESGDGYDRIDFDSRGQRRFGFYISGDYYEIMFYTEGSRLTLVGLDCDRTNSYGNCDSYSVAQAVTLDYQLTNDNKTLRLRTSGSAWDEWTRCEDDDYGKCYDDPIWASRR